MPANPTRWWPGINRQEPLARGLAAHWPIWEGAGGIIGDVANPAPAVDVATDYAVTVLTAVASVMAPTIVGRRELRALGVDCYSFGRWRRQWQWQRAASMNQIQGPNLGQICITGR